MSLDFTAIQMETRAPSCVTPFVEWVISMEGAGTLAKTVVYGVWFFAEVILTLSIVGIPLYHRLFEEYAIRRNTLELNDYFVDHPYTETSVFDNVSLEKDRLEENLSQSIASQQSLNNQILLKSEEFQNLQKEHSTQSIQKQQLEENVRLFSAELTSAKQTNSQSQQLISSLQQENHALQQSKETAKQEIEKIQQQVNNLTIRNNGLRDKLTTESTQLKACEKKLKSQQKVINDFPEVIELISLNAFKEKLKDLSVYKEDPQEIAKKLSEITPENLEPQKMVNLIFDCRDKRDIPLLLDAVLTNHPSFSLSPYDQLRRAIVEDKEPLFTNHTLMEKLEEYQLNTDEAKIIACYDLAYRLNNPHIYRLAKTAILTDAYTLNFLWINLNPQDRIQDTAQNIFKDGLDLSENAECIKDPNSLRILEKTEQSLEKDGLENWKQIKKSFTYRISRWADVNPNAQINLWYDSALVTQKAQQKTFEMMGAISKSRGVNLKLRDIRQLPIISDEISNSLHPGTQVYYRVDIAKAWIAHYLISAPEENAQYCVVCDIDVEPMSPQELFDQRTLDYLSSNGYVFSRVGWNNFENGFFIFNKEKKDLQEIHHKTIIKKTASHITSLRQHPIGTHFKSEAILGSQFVFNQYSNFRRQMKEPSDERLEPRKIVKCPGSQFNLGGTFPKSDFKAETFRFIGTDNIPYTLYGRNVHAYTEGQIDALINWEAKPLNLPV